MHIGIIGLGNLGTAIARISALNGHQVIGWEHDPRVVASINQDHCNHHYLPDIELPKDLLASSDLGAVIASAQLLFITLPSVYIRTSLANHLSALRPSTGVGLFSKGIDRVTGITAFAQLRSLLPDQPLAMVAGPSLANEFTRGIPTTVIAASDNPPLIATISMALSGPRFAVLPSNDPQGVELGAILKNIYALGFGLYGDDEIAGMNFRGAYITQAVYEMTQLGRCLGANPASLYFFSGLGDLVATALSEHSHNRNLGRRLAEGADLETLGQQLGTLPEGYNSLLAALTIAEQHHCSLPLAGLFRQCIEHRLPADVFFDQFIALIKTAHGATTFRPPL